MSAEIIKNLYWKLWIEYWCLRARLRCSHPDAIGAIDPKCAVDPDPLAQEPLPDSKTVFSPIWTVIGDSSANHLAQRFSKFTPVRNLARNGSTIDSCMRTVSTQYIERVILMVGGNNIGLLDEDPRTVVKKYYDLHSRIYSHEIIVVGLSPFNGTEGFAPRKNAVIREVNNRLEAVYNDTFVNTFPSAMLPSFTDGVHHTYYYDLQIMEAITRLAVGKMFIRQLDAMNQSKKEERHEGTMDEAS